MDCMIRLFGVMNKLIYSDKKIRIVSDLMGVRKRVD